MGKVGEKMGRRHTKLLIKLYSLNQGRNRDFYFWGSRLNYHIDSKFKKNSKYHTNISWIFNFKVSHNSYILHTKVIFLQNYLI